MQIKHFKALFLPVIFLLITLACSFTVGEPGLEATATSPLNTLPAMTNTPTITTPILPSVTLTTPVILPTDQVSTPCSASWFFAFDTKHLPLASFCPEPVKLLEAVGQDFEGGRAYRYAPDPSYTTDQRGTVFIIYNDGEWVTIPDSWDSSQPSSDPNLVAPEGRYQPIDSIGKVWRENVLNVRDRLGWAYEPQSKFPGRMQRYLVQPGMPSGDTHFSFIDHGKWGLVLILNSVDMGPNTWEVAGTVSISTPFPTTPTQTSEATGTDTPTTAIPVSSIQIEGVPYKAYQIPGDPFRFVCQEPCPLDERYILAEYAGFRLARIKLIQWTGVDTLTELQPVDMHLVLEDSVCGQFPYGHAYMYSSTHQAYTCTEGPGYYPTMEEKIQKAAQPENQYFPLHEYMHTIFFGRISGKAGDFQDYYAEFFHDYVVPLPSYATGDMDPAGFCSYRNEAPSRGDYPLWLISELCRQNGFQIQHVALSLIELDRLYQSGGGQVEAGFTQRVPTAAQYRDILNRLLGGDTTQAFADACWPAELFGNSYSVPPACLSLSTDATPTPFR